MSSYLCGLVFFSFVVYWVIQVTFIGAIVLFFYLALYFGVFGLGFKWIDENFKQVVLKILLTSSLWTALEFIRFHLMTGFGWAALGYSQYKYTKLIQIADITGVYGISFLIIFINTAIYYVFSEKLGCGETSLEKPGRIFCLAKKSLLLLPCIFLLSVCVHYGSSVLKNFKPCRDETIKVSIIQGNIPQDLKWNGVLKDLILKKYENLTLMAAFDKADVIVWPETSLPGYLEEKELRDAVSSLARSIQTALLIGTIRCPDFSEEYFNSAVLFNKNGDIAEIYDKIHLVPFGEYVPLKHVLFPFLLHYPIADFSRGSEYVLFEIKKRRFGVLICFEDIFPDLVRNFARQGADFMVNITNDAWFKKSSAAHQHNQALVFRAVENKISLVRCGNTGPSLFIEPVGTIKNRLVDQHGQDIFIDGFSTAELNERQKETFFTKFGDIFAYVCGLFFMAGWFMRAKKTPN